LANIVYPDECVDIGNAILNTEFRVNINIYEVPTDINSWEIKAEE